MSFIVLVWGRRGSLANSSMLFTAILLHCCSETQDKTTSLLEYALIDVLHQSNTSCALESHRDVQSVFSMLYLSRCWLSLCPSSLDSGVTPPCAGCGHALVWAFPPAIIEAWVMLMIFWWVGGGWFCWIWVSASSSTVSGGTLGHPEQWHAATVWLSLHQWQCLYLHPAVYMQMLHTHVGWKVEDTEGAIVIF